MSDTLTLVSTHDVSDLQTFLQRAERLGCSLTRLTVAGSFLVATVCVLEKQGLLDTHPNVLGARVVELDSRDNEKGKSVEFLVETRAILDRLARISARDIRTFDIPPLQPRVPWAGISPPRSNWEQCGEVSSAVLVATARAGIDEVAKANGLGSQIVTQVRRTVWSRSLADIPLAVTGLAFAAFGLGFVVEGEDEVVRLTSQGTWIRASTARGDVLARA